MGGDLYFVNVPIVISTSKNFKYYGSRHQIACFKVSAKSYTVATQTAKPGRVKTAQN
jgi:hypothetical protein